MNITKDKLGALFFFLFSISYGYYALQIPLYPGEEYDVFTSQTMPKLYAILAMLTSAVALLLSVIKDIVTTKNIDDSAKEPKTRFDYLGWTRCAALIALMIFYGLTLEPFGFILSTTTFLILGYLILGERRIKILFIASVPVVLVFWAIMTQLLGIYLSAGELWG